VLHALTNHRACTGPPVAVNRLWKGPGQPMLLRRLQFARPGSGCYCCWSIRNSVFFVALSTLSIRYLRRPTGWLHRPLSTDCMHDRRITVSLLVAKVPNTPKQVLYSTSRINGLICHPLTMPRGIRIFYEVERRETGGQIKMALLFCKITVL
jgi:hypothetical protein